MSDESPDDKQHEPSQKKLDDARQKGEVPKANDLMVALSYGGLILACYTFGEALTESLAEEFIIFWEDGLSIASAENGYHRMGVLASRALMVLVGLIGVPALAIVVTLTSLRLVTFAPEKLIPKVSRISILQNAKNKFGRNGLFEFAKSFTKLALFSICLSLYLRAHSEEFLMFVSLNARAAAVLLTKMGLEFLFIGFLIALAIGGVDYIWQHLEFRRQHRMSHKEMKDEHKEAEGDPHVKGQRRQRAQDLTQQQLAARVPEADVVIVNPEHYAVALAWSRAAGDVPKCVAKGVDATALRIKEIARESGVPIHRDPPTARTLFAALEIDQPIMPEHFRAVAAAIRFSDFVKSKQQSWR